MKLAIGFLIIGIIILVLFIKRSDVWVTKKTIDIHIHDTYFVIDKWHLAIAIFFYLLTFFSFGGVIGTKFKSKGFLLTFISTLLIVGYILWWLFNL
jgi:hypothetical protein